MVIHFIIGINLVIHSMAGGLAQNALVSSGHLFTFYYCNCNLQIKCPIYAFIASECPPILHTYNINYGIAAWLVMQTMIGSDSYLQWSEARLWIANVILIKATKPLAYADTDQNTVKSTLAHHIKHFIVNGIILYLALALFIWSS